MESHTMTLIMGIATLLFVLLRKWWVKQRKLYALAENFEKPPGFSRRLFTGHAHHYNNLEIIITIARSFTKAYGVVFLGLRPIFYLNEPNLFEDCLTNDKCLNKPNQFDIIKQITNSMYLQKDNEWRQKKKVLLPVFKQSVLGFYTKIFTKHDLRFARQMESQEGKVFNMFEFYTKTNFHKYFDCAYGLDSDKRGDDYLKALLWSFSIVQTNLYNLRSIKFINDIIGNGKDFDNCMAIIKNITKEIVAERLKIMKETGNSIVQNDDYDETIVIDYLLQSIKTGKFDESHLVSELIGFVFASIDTSSNTFSFLCVCLALHPEIQEKVYEEIVQVTGERSFLYSDYQHLTYLQMVIKETLRLFPVGPILHRQTSSDVKIGEYVYPKDSILHLNIISIHRSPKYYPDPLKFDPERFAPDSEDGKNRHRFAYLPFSAGKRYCIGEKFAMLSLLSAAVTIFKKYRIETTYRSIEEIRLETQFALNAVEGYPIRIYPRN